ncbi:MAG: peptidoglycan-binding protein [Candidatus Peregrinibacteria bacterium]|nr:peptidoglycan-binding protein [Candidatus Peregrinibacteria bacterium]MDZ4244734.1 peptidoglycan-binding protein [Candidatus Gracilibacteria bacterium]
MFKRFNTLLTVTVLFATLFHVSVSFADATDIMMPYKQTFITTAYYSPLPDQDHYVTGSYYGDTRLNGNGTNGASGAEVFPGMLAAPKSYPFGFKIDIPGIGISEIQDRGGAIVHAGELGQEHDRLDVWMGAGDAGLRRALLWGKRTVLATVYGARPELLITAGFSGWDENELALVKYWKENVPQYIGGTVAKLFPTDLWFGQNSEKVAEMQQLLADLGYFFEDIDGTYNDATAQAVYYFQRDNDLVYDWSELGSGHFGPQTRITIEKAKELLEKGEYVNQTAYLEKIQKYDDLKEEFTVYTDDLYLGSKGEDVRELQKDLITLGYLRTEVSGFYGEVTENAVKHFQMKTGIIATKESQGAGVVGRRTRSTLNALFDKRIETKGMLASKRDDTQAVVLLASTDEVVETKEEVLSIDDSAEIIEIEDLKAVEDIIIEEAVSALAFGSRGSEVKSLQSELRNRGYFNSGFLTTYFGEKTKDALIAFQLDYELISDPSDTDAGVLTSETRELLFS